MNGLLSESPSLSIVSSRTLKLFSDGNSKIELQRMVWDRWGKESIEFNVIVTAECSGSTTFQFKTFKLAKVVFELLKAGLQ
jgi:hypothetical protein